MVNIFSATRPITNALMKHAGVRPQLIEIEPGTIMNFWIPIETVKNKPVHNKPALLLLHCFAADGILTWQFQVMALSSKYSIYVPDFLFFGRSFTNKKDRSPEFQAQCLAKGLSKLGVDKCIAVGLSYGGMVGFKVAEMYPSLVRGLVVSGSVVALTESMSSESLERLGLSSWSEGLLPNTAEGVKVMLSFGTYKVPWLPNFLLQHFLEVMFTNRKQREELLEALVVSDKDFQTPHFSQTIHMLWGENDKVFTMDLARKIKEELGEKTILLGIEKAGHLSPLERPCVFNRCLEKLLDSIVADEKEE